MKEIGWKVIWAMPLFDNHNMINLSKQQYNFVLVL